jgi:predicted GH43/DUF377 family glycosyl hydrolase|tara:strand:+ start:2836 stop:3801 length:966 start_codon:yes stop_codon:yes gene_type:complete
LNNHSLDNQVFTKNSNNPLLSVGSLKIPFLSWDGLWVYHPNITIKDGKYYMLYTGRGGLRLRHQIGLAMSDDLLTWKKYRQNPVFKIGSTGEWDDEFVAHGYVFAEGNKYYMYYSGCPSKIWREEIGLAVSDNLITWQRYEHNPIIQVGKAGTWEGNHVSRCYVLKIDDKYHIYYAGHDGSGERIGLATSEDLHTWIKYPVNPVLDLGSKGSWDERSISDPRIHKIGKMYVMQYSGYDAKGTGRIGFAYSGDALNWKKFRDNPVIGVGDGMSWDRSEVCRGDIIKIKDEWLVFYSGFNSINFGIGLASGQNILENIISNLK